MIKVFLVEDEIVMREGIKNNIDWAQEGFDFVGEASDGELAYPMIKKLKPDIVITDIKMPFMDGLELSRLVKAEYPEIKVIILSGYDEFDYAKKAINIGVTEYLLKPITGNKLMEAVKQVAKIIEEEKRQQEYIEKFEREMKENETLERQKFFYEIVNNKLPVAEILEKGNGLGIDLWGSAYNIILLHIFLKDANTEQYSDTILSVEEELEEHFKDKKDINLFSRALEGWSFLVKETGERSISEIIDGYIEELTKIILSYTELSFFMGVGKTVHRLREVGIAFDEANKAFAFRYIMNKNKVVYSEKLNTNEYLANTQAGPDIDLEQIDIGKLEQSAIEEFLKFGSKNDIKNFVEEYFYSIGQANMNSLIFRQYITMNIYFCVVSFMKGLGCNTAVLTEKCGYLEEVHKVITCIDETKQYLGTLFENAITYRNQVSNKKYGKLINSAQNYILHNYHKEDVSLNLVAASVNLSPNHFSTIFSQEAGKTFIEYLTDVRMEKAKELLRYSDLRNSEIAFKVGYKDAHYFSYIFKKTQNCSPKEFRSKGK